MSNFTGVPVANLQRDRFWAQHSLWGDNTGQHSEKCPVKRPVLVWSCRDVRWISETVAVRPELMTVTETTLCLSVWNRLSTYEYIVRQRHRHDRDSKPEALKDTMPPSVLKVKCNLCVGTLFWHWFPDCLLSAALFRTWTTQGVWVTPTLSWTWRSLPQCVWERSLSKTQTHARAHTHVNTHMSR